MLLPADVQHGAFLWAVRKSATHMCARIFVVMGSLKLTQLAVLLHSCALVRSLTFSCLSRVCSCYFYLVIPLILLSLDRPSLDLFTAKKGLILHAGDCSW